MKPSLDFETQLHAIPVRNEKLRICDEQPKPDELVVEIQLRYQGLLGAFARVVKARPHKRYVLAGLSRELFERLDGRQTVEALIDGLCEQERLTFLEGRALVLQYLRDLMGRGLVVIVSAKSRE